MKTTVYSPPSEQTHFLVSGGGKGITAANAAALAEAYHCRFTLVGRSQLNLNEPAWADGLSEEADLKQAALDYHQAQGQKVTPKEIGREVKGILSSREIKHTLDQIEQAGGKAAYVQADITDPASLKDSLLDQLADINGLLHGAGVLADKYIEDKSAADFELVYGTKVGGLKHILEIIPPDQLDYLVLFSSVAGYYGNAGQADYSISNEVLNKLAHHIKHTHPACQVLAVGWGPWDGGMVSPQLKRILTRRNVPLISLEEGTSALVELLATPQDNPQHIIGNPLPIPPAKMPAELERYLISRELTLERNPFLADHVIGGKAVLPTVCAVAWFVNSCQNLYPGYQFFAVKDYSVFKGIVFDQDSADEYFLELQELEKSAQAVMLEGKISSPGPGGSSRFHYQAKVEMRKDLPDQPRMTDFSLEEDNPITGSSLYDSRVLFHGPRFQGIEKVLNISPSGLTTRCRLPAFTTREMGQFPLRSFNPYLADVHLQSMLVWAHTQQGSLGLPLQIASGVQYQPVPFDIPTYATMRVKSITNHKLVADVISHDQQGNVYLAVTDAEITLNQKLYDLFQSNQLEQEPVWI